MEHVTKLVLLLLVGCSNYVEQPKPLEGGCATAVPHRLYIGNRFRCTTFPVVGKWVTAAHCVRNARDFRIDRHDGPQVFWEVVNHDEDWAVGTSDYSVEGFVPGTLQEGPVTMWGYPSGVLTQVEGTASFKKEGTMLRFSETTEGGQSGGVFAQGCYALGITAWADSISASGPLLPMEAL